MALQLQDKGGTVRSSAPTASDAMAFRRFSTPRFYCLLICTYYRWLSYWYRYWRSIVIIPEYLT